MLKRFGHLLCFYCPGLVFLFLITGPHDADIAIAWTIPMGLLILADWLGPRLNKQQPYPDLSDRYYNFLLYSLAFLQLANIMLMVNYVSQLQWSTQQQLLTSAINLITLRLLVGTSSGISGIIVSHELIHRSYRPMRYLGRLLLCSVCYDHFTFSHYYGHHREVAKPHDIATARLGESFNHYWKRVLVDNFLFAWSYEQTRLKTTALPNQPLAILKNRVLHGVLLESALILAIFYCFGWIAGIFFLYQAFVAVRILEATNYYQHWGMGADHSDSILAWVNDSWVSCYALLGLTLHIDHHCHAARHFQNLHYNEQGPRMPYGYFVMNFWVKLNNPAFQKHALNELQFYKPIKFLQS